MGFLQAVVADKGARTGTSVGGSGVVGPALENTGLGDLGSVGIMSGFKLLLIT